MTVSGSFNLGIASTAVGVASTAPELKFYEFEPPIEEESTDPFIFNEDGTLDFTLTGKLIVEGNARFENNVNIPTGTLTVQEVDILAAIQELQNTLGTIQSDISTLFSTLQG